MAPLPLDDANMPLFTVGQVAEMLEVQQAFLRRLDEFHVVRPSRSAGGQRRYTRNEIVVVRYVVDLIDDGLTLSAVRRVLQLEARVRELQAERDALRAALAHQAGPAGQGRRAPGASRMRQAPLTGASASPLARLTKTCGLMVCSAVSMSPSSSSRGSSSTTSPDSSASVPARGVSRMALTCWRDSTSLSRALLRGSSERLILILHMAMRWPSKSE